jgi:ribonuclease HI
MTDSAVIHIDGAARGNPGPAAYAVVITRPGEPPVEESDTLGTATNNVAEYSALVAGLERAAELGLRRLDVFSDSELLVKQMGGEYRVKHPDLLPLFEEAKRLRQGFERVTLTHVRRAQNARADQLCNEALDGRPRRRGDPNPPPLSASRPAAPPKKPAAAVTDAAVRADVLDCLRSAARAWADHGLNGLKPEAVWEQLWSILEDGGVLRKKAK